MARWAGTRTGLSYIPPGAPWRNGYIESFNSRIHDGCLNINTYYSLLHAHVVISDWKTEYNHDRRHSSLGYLAPADYARQCIRQLETDTLRPDRTVRAGHGSNCGGARQSLTTGLIVGSIALQVSSFCNPRKAPRVFSLSTAAAGRGSHNPEANPPCSAGYSFSAMASARGSPDNGCIPPR